MTRKVSADFSFGFGRNSKAAATPVAAAFEAGLRPADARIKYTLHFLSKWALCFFYATLCLMKKGVDYIGVAVGFRCHDGKGNYLMHKRGINCRDECGRWDFGGGGLKFGERIEDGLRREVKEEYGADIISYDFLCHRETFREHNGKSTHWVGFAYKVLVDPKQVINNEPEKHDEIGWFTADKLPAPLHSQIEKNLKANPL